MALPKLNASPQYTCKVPSTGDTVSYRPYLVKEEKILMIAFETGHQKEALNAIVNTLDACIENIDARSLTTFDVEYLFTQVRSKSVGESATIVVPCSNEGCGHKNEVSLDIAAIQVKFPEDQENTIEITDNISVEMQYPKYSDVLKMDLEEGDQTEMGFAMLAQSIAAILTEDERIDASESTQEELIDFIESMTSDQFAGVSKFLSELPAIEHDLKFACEGCGETVERKLKGISDFLS